MQVRIDAPAQGRQSHDACACCGFHRFHRFRRSKRTLRRNLRHPPPGYSEREYRDASPPRGQDSHKVLACDGAVAWGEEQEATRGSWHRY